MQVKQASWRPTLEHILDSGTPAVFTTYVEQEAKSELKVFKGMGARVSKEMQENKWRGQEPRIDHSEGKYNYFYQNYFWYIVKGKV